MEFDIGDRVLLKLTPQTWKNIVGNNQHHELVPKYDGSFEVMGSVVAIAYRLELLKRLKLHLTFHLNYLKPFHEYLEDSKKSRSLRAPPTIKKQFE